MARRLVLNIAVSLDGYIAREDGSYDWIIENSDSPANTSEQFDNDGFFKSCDTIIMGYQSYRDCPIEMIDDYEHKQFIVASRKEHPSTAHVTFSKTIIEDIKQLKKQDGTDIWLFGGANLADQVISLGLVDEYIIGIIPVILGKGKRLFTDNTTEIPLTLIQSTVTNGIAMVRYLSTDTQKS
ncbi:dihydrofolate reductase family protein [Streptococcus hyovaginalis]